MGIKKIRKVQMSRGGKEGNNALTKDLQNVDKEDHMTYAMKNNVSKATLDLLIGQGVGSVSTGSRHMKSLNVW